MVDVARTIVESSRGEREKGLRIQSRRKERRESWEEVGVAVRSLYGQTSIA